MRSRISATEAARRFSDVVNRVRYRGERFVVERGGEPVCEIAPAGADTVKGRDLVGLLKSLPRPDDEFFKIVRAIARKQPRAARSPWPR